MAVCCHAAASASGKGPNHGFPPRLHRRSSSNETHLVHSAALVLEEASLASALQDNAGECRWRWRVRHCCLSQLSLPHEGMLWICRDTGMETVSGTQLGPDRSTPYPPPDTHTSTKVLWHSMDKALMCSLAEPAVVSGLWGHPEDRPSAISSDPSAPCRATATFAFNYYAGRIKKILERQQGRWKAFMISKADLLI